ncbi:HEPN domain-containing protein [Pedobacter sp. MC2016-24]|uniref:HEPN domain-containing protein n=1 Tax=Pedobacter sp. MC2016-24 TaxID=2780090 RepID=UPI00187EB827|nr:HEPN domain-containing protein [Pedobacter sp. MC2016-24]MBE9599850.1 HEPN domain-containing protein [Pedobacter sp. MC2016-24]
MKTSITHLPDHKQQEIREILNIIKEETNPEKIILFGSHATGNWVEDSYIDKGATYTYISDYDFLIVINNATEIKEHDIISRIENRTLKYKNEVSPIIHDIEYINTGLEKGQYFFQDIVNEGILLFDTGKYQFSEAKIATVREQKEVTEYYYQKWIESGIRMFEHTTNSFNYAIEKSFPFNEVIFYLHQATERFYAGLLLVYTGYKPKSHSLKDYRRYSKHISEKLNQVFLYPAEDMEERRLFKILHKSYVDSRYKDDYCISKEDLELLMSKIEDLKDIVVRLCNEKIKALN